MKALALYEVHRLSFDEIEIKEELDPWTSGSIV